MRKVFAVCFLVLGSCTNNKPDNDDTIVTPSHFPLKTNQPNHNTLSKEGIALGRQLFFDSTLSKNKNISCQSCHLPVKAFTDGVSLSIKGTSGKALIRNSPTLVNLLWSTSFFWDGGASDLESQAFLPLTHPDEMGMDLNELVLRLNQKAEYKNKFKQVFDIDTITSPYVARALAQFQRTIISANSRYDRFVLKKEALSKIEIKGLTLFYEKKCAHCHTPPLFHDNSFHNNGIDSFFKDTNDGSFLGRYRISNNKEDIGKFKTPTLRNIELTDPYMHDGRFKSLDEVLLHYSKKIVHSPTLDTLFIKKKGNVGIDLTQEEREAILKFLVCLTDGSLIRHSSNRKLE